MSYKGIYRPINPQKYVGDPNKIVYRSSWERRLMKKFDLSDNIVHWASEEIHIPYYNPIDKKKHRYFPDFVIKHKNGKKYLIEVKPYNQTLPPKPPKKNKSSKRYLREQLEFIKNQAKWKAAKSYCDDNALEFKVITEKELGLYS